MIPSSTIRVFFSFNCTFRLFTCRRIPIVKVRGLHRFMLVARTCMRGHVFVRNRLSFLCCCSASANVTRITTAHGFGLLKMAILADLLTTTRLAPGRAKLFPTSRRHYSGTPIFFLRMRRETQTCFDG